KVEAGFRKRSCAKQRVLLAAAAGRDAGRRCLRRRLRQRHVDEDLTEQLAGRQLAGVQRLVDAERKRRVGVDDLDLEDHYFLRRRGWAELRRLRNPRVLVACERRQGRREQRDGEGRGQQMTRV